MPSLGARGRLAQPCGHRRRQQIEVTDDLHPPWPVGGEIDHQVFDHLQQRRELVVAGPIQILGGQHPDGDRPNAHLFAPADELFELVSACVVADRDGFCRLEEHMNAQDRAGLHMRTLSQYGAYMPGYRPGGAGVAALRDTLDQCRKAGWRTAILLTPETATFQSWYPPEGRAELDALLKSLADEYGVPLVDGRNWLPDELNLDGHHLSGPGADAFTDTLGQKFVGPWLRSNPHP